MTALLPWVSVATFFDISLADRAACTKLITDADFVRERERYLGSSAAVSQWHDCVDYLRRDPPEKQTHVLNLIHVLTFQ